MAEEKPAHGGSYYEDESNLFDLAKYSGRREQGEWREVIRAFVECRLPTGQSMLWPGR